MNQTLKKWIGRLVFTANIIVIMVSLLALLSFYLKPATWWFVALAGLAFPFSIAAVFLFFILWLFLNKKRAITNLVTIIICAPAIYLSFGVHIFSSFKPSKAADNIRVLTWNVGLMNYNTLDTNEAKENNRAIIQKIQANNADIVCLQEFFSSTTTGYRYNFIDSISKQLGYPHYYFSRDVNKFDDNFFNGTIIFSRFEMADTSRHIFPLEGLYGGSVIKAGIVVNKDTIDIVSTRLQLMRFNAEEYKELSSIKHISGKSFTHSRSLIGKLRTGYYFLSQQARFTSEVIKQSRRPVIFMGDINDVPLSYTYGTIKADMHDAWANGGKGIGKTFQYISPTLRLDEIFYSNHFKLQQVKRVLEQGETDRNGVLADLYLK